MTGTPTYRSWSSMIYRCENQKHAHFDKYGGRGISVCAEWRASFECFLIDMGQRPEGMTLDRRDNDGNYSKDNCRWATRSQQNANQFHPKKPGLGMVLHHEGIALTVKAWSERLGIPVATIHKRIKNGLPPHKALSTERQSANQYFRR